MKKVAVAAVNLFMSDYFSLLNLPQSFTLDLSELEQRYFAKQREFHPDRLIGKSASERTQAISNSMSLNSAYSSLKEPLSRAQHLLELNGIDIEKTKPSSQLLIEIMEIREKIAEISGKQDLEILEKENQQRKRTAIEQITTAFAQNELSTAAQHTIYLSYINKIDDELRVKIKNMFCTN